MSRRCRRRKNCESRRSSRRTHAAPRDTVRHRMDPSFGDRPDRAGSKGQNGHRRGPFGPPGEAYRRSMVGPRRAVGRPTATRSPSLRSGSGRSHRAAPVARAPTPGRQPGGRARSSITSCSGGRVARRGRLEQGWAAHHRRQPQDAAGGPGRAEGREQGGIAEHGQDDRGGGRQDRRPGDRVDPPRPRPEASGPGRRPPPRADQPVRRPLRRVAGERRRPPDRRVGHVQEGGAEGGAQAVAQDPGRQAADAEGHAQPARQPGARRPSRSHRRPARGSR